LILAVLRLLAAWAWRGPALPDHVSAAEKFIAFGVHTVLYGLMVLVPLLGWAAASAGGLLPQPPLFDTLEIPPLMPKQDESVTEFLFDMHKLAAMGLAGLASLHMLAALSHLIRADGVFSRIWGHE
jgi:cytochrome b561